MPITVFRKIATFATFPMKFVVEFRRNESVDSSHSTRIVIKLHRRAITSFTLMSRPDGQRETKTSEVWRLLVGALLS